MGSTGRGGNKPHAVCIPFPAQGHINPMLKLSKLLHHKGFHITFVNTDYNHRRLLNSRGPNALDGLPSFRFHTIPDGLPPSDADATQHIPDLCRSTSNDCLPAFKDLLARLNDGGSSGVPPVTCIVSDGAMTFTLAAAEELGIPEVLFWTSNATIVLCYSQFRNLVDKGYVPLKDASCLENGYMQTSIDWIPAMEGILLSELPSFIRTTDPEEYMVKFVIQEMERAKKSSAIMINTFDALEQGVIDALSLIFPLIKAIGPLHLMQKQIDDDTLQLLGSNLWKEDESCLKWLDKKEPNSVIYVNFGSITTVTQDQMVEFAWGLANSKHDFLWIIRPDMVTGDSAVLPPEFLKETENRGMLVSWCPQEQVLSHTAIGGFLTHCGWNSVIETVSCGVPMICWPFYADQMTNCWCCCKRWGVGMEMGSDVKREELERLVRELIAGEKGKEMRRKAIEWKKMAQDAVKCPDGSSSRNLDDVIHKILLSA